MRCFDLLLYQCALFLPVCPVFLDFALGGAAVSLARPTPHPVGYAPGLRPFAHTPPRRPLCARCPSGPPARIRGRPPSIITTPIHTHQSPTANAAPTHKNSQKVQMKGCFFLIIMPYLKYGYFTGFCQPTKCECPKICTNMTRTSFSTRINKRTRDTPLYKFI